ncbi:hypothetical protein K438DRAFT_2071788 [Mycena galopus ATCC 62051]|nr:hypothetical protein K438DRAFT_2071788 [Mycena galopus ATCC 62051]
MCLSFNRGVLQLASYHLDSQSDRGPSQRRAAAYFVDTSLRREHRPSGAAFMNSLANNPFNSLHDIICDIRQLVSRRSILATTSHLPLAGPVLISITRGEPHADSTGIEEFSRGEYTDMGWPRGLRGQTARYGRDTKVDGHSSHRGRSKRRGDAAARDRGRKAGTDYRPAKDVQVALRNSSWSRTNIVGDKGNVGRDGVKGFFAGIPNSSSVAHGCARASCARGGCKGSFAGVSSISLGRTQTQGLVCEGDC